MDKKQEKKIWNSQLAIENPKNDRIAVIYSVKVSSVRILSLIHISEPTRPY